MGVPKSSRRSHSQEGAVAIIVALLLVALLAFAAIVVDAGAIYAQRRHIQTAADAAALAGVQELPFDPSAAISLAEAYAAENSAEADDVLFTVESTFVLNDTLVAQLQDPSFGLFFARFMRIQTAAVDAEAVAIVGSPTTYGSGVMPFGIVASQTVEPPYGYEPGSWIELIPETGGQSQGNWHYLDLAGHTSGADNTKGVISEGGTTEPLSIDDIIYTQTGGPNNPNFKELSKYFNLTCSPHELEDLQYDEERDVWQPLHHDGSPCNRLITCPVIVVAEGDPYDWDELRGKSVKVKIVGFVNIFIGNNPAMKDDNVLWGKFVQTVPTDVMSPGRYTDYAGIIYWLER